MSSSSWQPTVEPDQNLGTTQLSRHSGLIRVFSSGIKSSTPQQAFLYEHHRAVILIRKKSNNRMHVLVSEKTAAHLPVCQINPMRSIHSTLKKYLTEIFGAEIPAHKVIWTVSTD